MSGLLCFRASNDSLPMRSRDAAAWTRGSSPRRNSWARRPGPTRRSTATARALVSRSRRVMTRKACPGPGRKTCPPTRRRRSARSGPTERMVGISWYIGCSAAPRRPNAWRRPEAAVRSAQDFNSGWSPDHAPHSDGSVLVRPSRVDGGVKGIACRQTRERETDRSQASRVRSLYSGKPVLESRGPSPSGLKHRRASASRQRTSRLFPTIASHARTTSRPTLTSTPRPLRPAAARAMAPRTWSPMVSGPNRSTAPASTPCRTTIRSAASRSDRSIPRTASTRSCKVGSPDNATPR